MSAKDYVIAPSILSANFAKLGEEVAACVVLREGAALTERELQAFIGQRAADNHLVDRDRGVTVTELRELLVAETINEILERGVRHGGLLLLFGRGDDLFLQKRLSLLFGQAD